MSNHRLIRDLTIIADLVLINLAFAFAYLVRYRFQWLLPVAFVVPYSSFIGQQLLLTLILAVTFTQNKVWAQRRGEFIVDEVSRLGYATATGIALMMAFTFFFRPLAFSRLLLVWALLFIVLFIAGARLLRRLLLGLLYRQGVLTDPALVVGGGETGRSVMRTLLARPDLGYRVIGYLSDGSDENHMGLGRIPHLGHMNELEEILQTNPKLHTVFIALSAELHHQIGNLVRLCQRQGIRAQVAPDLFELSLNSVEFSQMAGLPLLSVREVRLSRASQIGKRILDLALTLTLGTVLALPVCLLIALAIKLDSPGPIFFVQERIGQHGKPFKMIKFRSMVVNAEDQKEALRAMNEASGPIFKIRNDPRLTRTGRVIRRLSLDELPQVINVIRNEMSLVGPRPPLAEEVAQYQPWHRQRLEVKGGITGLWQVSGRSDLTFDEQCLLDIYYIENWSLALDARILLQTIPFSLFGRGAY